MNKKRRSPLSFLIILLLIIGLLVQFGEQWIRHLLLYLSSAKWAKAIVSTSSLAWRVASRFVAGEDISSAISATRRLNQKGMRVTLDYLGENVVHAQDAIDARDHIIDLLNRIHAEKVKATVSIKLSQIGLRIDEQLTFENAYAIVKHAQKLNNKIRIDMEESSTVDITLSIFNSLRLEHGFQNIGIVVQSYLYRCEKDVVQLIEEGASVRLCKGAYAESAEVAFVDKADTDENYVKMMQLLLSEKARENKVLFGAATHDHNMIQATIAYTKATNIPKDAFEFQMLYGIQRKMQESLINQGYQCRVYVPFGTAWYSYFVRRLAERPANLWFFLSNFVR